MQKCRVCNWQGEVKKIRAKEMMYGTGEEFDYFECPACGCLQIEEIPGNLGKYYQNENYYSFGRPEGKKINVEAKSDMRILDVGCGAGHYLCLLYESGYTNLTGCDPFLDEDIEYENGVKIYKKTIHEMEGQFDEIRLSDSFEHVTDPHEVMDSIHRLLAPRGHVFIRIPVYPNLAFDTFGVNWYQLDAPRHIILHSKKSMIYLAEKHGFRVAKTEWNSGTWMIERSFLYEKGIPFVEQTEGVIKKYFPLEYEVEVYKTCHEMNKKEYGDHADFILTRAEDGIPVF